MTRLDRRDGHEPEPTYVREVVRLDFAVPRRQALADKMRVHILAKQLNVSSKAIVEKCRAEGVDSIKNHMSTLSAGLHATVCEWFSEGSHDVTVETSERVDLKTVRVKRKPKAAPKRLAATASTEQTTPTDTELETVSAGAVAAETMTASRIAGEPEVATTLVAEPEPPAAEPLAPPPEIPPVEIDAQAAVAEAPTAPTAESPSVGEAELADHDTGADDDAESIVEQSPAAPPPVKPEELVRPAGPQHVPAPAKLQGPRVVRYEAPDYDVAPRRPPSPPSAPRTDSDQAAARASATQGPASPARTGDKDATKRRGRVNPRRAATRLAEVGERMAEWRDRDLAERKERLAGATGRRMIRRRSTQAGADRAYAGPLGPKTEATVHEPVRMKEFCSATGLNFMQLFKVLRDEHQVMANINMVLPSDTAVLLALSFAIDLEVIPARTKLDDIRDDFASRERTHEQTRPPVVTMLGHVDHGKTSLLDAIRKSQVVAGEDGGITQHISSYHVRSAHGPVTFLDTPGHAAFTAMRARGAEVTDVVVLVIAADDGIMPQTVEAINHAKAAEAPIVVALNKIDLGDQNKLKIYGQLAEHGLTPSGDWGGEVDVLETSATTNQGVAELVEHLADLAEVLELKADPTLPACGTITEAETKQGVGAVAQVLIRDGTLRVGDFVVCGNGAGKVRAILNDRGERLTQAGPSLPVEVWGLDDVPASGDTLYRVDSLQRAKDIASEVKQARLKSSRQQSRKVTSLQEMLLQRDSDEIPELNIVIKADVDGSVTALKQALSEIPSDEVKLAIRHTGVGAVNDSDILLASTCKGIVIAFRVETAVGARSLIDLHGVDVRSYRVIYNACDDIKKALEGLLAPEESIKTRGRAEVREVFHLSKKGGVVAGSYVTDGVLHRSHLLKIVRDGAVVRENARIVSLRRFKDDAKEVRAGLECGLRVDGFDDIHVGDTVETYEIIKTPRTL